MLKNTVCTLVGLALLAPSVAHANPTEAPTADAIEVAENETMLAYGRPYRPRPIRPRPVVRPRPIVRPSPIVVAPVAAPYSYYAPEFHIGIGVTGSALLADDSGALRDLNGGVGMEFSFGWRLADEFSLDFSLMFSDLPAEYTDTTGGGLLSLSMDGRYFFVPVDQRAQPYLQMGFGYYGITSDDRYGTLDGFGFHVGGGVDFYLNRAVSLGAKALYRGAFLDNSSDTYPYGATINEFVSFFTFGADLKFHF